MARKTLPLFFLSLTIFISGCGGSLAHPTPTPIPVATPVPNPTPVPPTLTADEVFVNIPQTWEFLSPCRNLMPDGSRGPVVEAHTFVDVTPVDPTHSIWHYTKDQPCAYWMPDGINAELYFFLEQDSTGAWYSTGGHIIAPFGYPWDSTHAPQDFTYTLTIDPTKPRPYLIIPAQSSDMPIVMATTFLDFQGPDTPWVTVSQTVFANTPFYTGYAMRSGQKEGLCPVCADEGWLLGLNGIGMFQITVYNTGSGPLVNPIVLVRIK